MVLPKAGTADMMEYISVQFGDIQFENDWPLVGSPAIAMGLISQTFYELVIQIM